MAFGRGVSIYPIRCFDYLDCCTGWCLGRNRRAARRVDRERYETVFKEWKATYVEALRVWSEFRICEESEADDLRRRYLDLKNQGDLLANRTIMAAADCVEGAITPDPVLIAFLTNLTLKYFAESRYENSARVGRALLKHDQRNLSLMYNTIRSAFFANDFEYAGELFEKWLEIEEKLPAELQSMYDSLAQLTKSWQRELALRKKEALENRLPRVVFVTTKGHIVVELFEDQAPVIVNNLMVYIENVKNPFYNNLSFFFVLQHQFAVTGSVTDDGTQTYPVGEATEQQRKVARGGFRGAVSLDISSPPGGRSYVGTGCRFILVPIQDLEETSLVIGRVIEGMDVVAKLQATHELNDLLDAVPVESGIPDRIIRVFVQRKPEGKEYKPAGVLANKNEN